MIDHCVEQLQREREEKGYRQYIADVLRLMGENAAMLTHGSYYPGRWGEAPPPEDNRTGDEIAADIIKRAGLTVGGETK